MKTCLLFLIPTLLSIAIIYYAFPATSLELLIKMERTLARLEKKQIEVNGLRFSYLEGGQGETLVMLHGFGADKDNWTRSSRHLTTHFRVIAPDHIGFGDSDSAADGNYHMEHQTERLASFLGALNIRSFHLAGNSMGGYIASAYAAQHPEQIKTLLLLAPKGVANHTPSELDNLLKAGQPNRLIINSLEEYDRLMDFVFVQRPYIPAPILKSLAETSISRHERNSLIYKQIVSDALSLPLETLIGGLQIPTLILWGTSDRVLDVSGAKSLAQSLPNSELQLLDNVGHTPMIEQPRDTAQRLTSFIERHTPQIKKDPNETRTTTIPIKTSFQPLSRGSS